MNKFTSLILQVATLNSWFCEVMGKLLDWEITDLDSGSRSIMN